jgi:hypothetical protein
MNIYSKMTVSAVSLAAILSMAAMTASAATGTKSASTTQQRIDNMQTRGDNMIDQRISSLNDLSTRIQGLKNVSDTEKASFSATIQSEITTLTDLKATIGSDTSTTTAKTDVASITKAYRVYALILPQMRIVAASDRVGTIVGLMDTLGTKLQTRLASSTDASLQADLSDFNAKVSDANTQAQAASAEVAALKPDNGDKTIMASNTAALKDARSKIQAATKDLQAARKDAQTIIQALKGSEGASASASTTTQ